MQPSENCEFFIYGGIFFPLRILPELNRRVATIREDAGYQPGDTFKFDTRARPEYVSRECATTAKAQVLQMCSELGVQFIAHIILHQIVERQDHDRRVLWAADYVIARYNKYLREEANSYGICVVDNLPVRAEWQYLSDRYSKGLELSSGNRVALDRIELFSATCIGASHASSVIDIVLGSFRYCVNNPPNPEVAISMLAVIAPMMWHRNVDGVHHVRDYGLVVRPPIEEVRVPAYKRKYLDLIDHLQGLLDATEEADGERPS